MICNLIGEGILFSYKPLITLIVIILSISTISTISTLYISTPKNQPIYIIENIHAYITSLLYNSYILFRTKKKEAPE